MKEGPDCCLPVAMLGSLGGAVEQALGKGVRKRRDLLSLLAFSSFATSVGVSIIQISRQALSHRAIYINAFLLSRWAGAPTLDI